MTPRPENAGNHRAYVIALLLLGFDLLILLQNQFLFAMGSTDLFWSLPLRWADHLLVAGLLGSLFLVVQSQPLLRRPYLLALFVINLLLLIDQQVYRVFFTTLVSLSQSVWVVLDGLAVLNIVVLLLVT